MSYCEFGEIFRTLLVQNIWGNFLAPSENSKMFWDFLAINSFHPSVEFHIETSHLIYTANEMIGFQLK